MARRARHEQLAARRLRRRPDAHAAADWLDSNALQQLAERVEALERGPCADESPEWRDARPGFSDYILELDPAQLTALTAELDEVIERYRAGGEADPAPDARQVLLYLYGVPRVEDPS